MTDPIYARLADALDRLPNGYPRTASGVELRILERIFTPEEAALGAVLTYRMQPDEEIAAQAAMEVRAVRSLLLQMGRKGLVWFERRTREPRGGVDAVGISEGQTRAQAASAGSSLAARLAPFVVGFYEAQVDELDHELAHLVEHYFEEGGAKGIMGPEPALHRVMPAHAAVAREAILPYEDVRAILLASKSFRVRDCICRKEQDLLGTRECDFPLENCLSFSSQERPLGPGDLTQEQALALLDTTEEIGLVHTVSNVQRGVGYICNCCGCCCGILRGITKYGLEHSVARANYYAEIDAEACIGCGICVDRCQVGAMSLPDDVAAVERARCIGCGLCVTGCTQEAVKLVRLPDAEIVPPPEDYDAWQEARLRNRGLA